MNVADKLINDIIKTKNPSVIGLDPDIIKIPACYKEIAKSDNPLKDVADVILNYNRDIIDTICDIAPAVKPQIAFYEKYGSYGIYAFEKTVLYAKSKGLTVIEDAKRNDIGNTAKAYADGHLGSVELLNGSQIPVINADFLTVTPFLGSESLIPFIDVCKKYNKGIFILVKTSNTSSGEIQNVITSKGKTVSEEIAEFIYEKGKNLRGSSGYSPIGAVVGATYPEDAVSLRNIMSKSLILVPGYGAQGGSANDIIPCFNPDGLGAIVNSSRGILYSHMSDKEISSCSKSDYLFNVRSAALKMQTDIYSTLKKAYPKMIY